jgi:hypothetical protein
VARSTIVLIFSIVTFLTGDAIGAHKGASDHETANDVLSHFTSDMIANLQKTGVVLVEHTGEDGTFEGLVIFDPPLDRIWHLLIQGDRQNEYRPELKRIRTIDKGPNHSLEEHELRIMFISLTYRLRFELNRDQNFIGWSLDPDFKNDVDHISGNWQLYEMEDGRTLARFETRVRVGGALPGWLQDTVSRKKIPQTLKRCRVWANNEG